MSAFVQLTLLERAVLDFEREWKGKVGAKETQIREQMGISATRYYQMLNALLSDERALAVYPSLIYRLRHQVEARRR
ncbi:MAG: DUF3263 domain-containing protein [bacterium]|nr:DUF3263 domain-containing protein [bacterium]